MECLKTNKICSEQNKKCKICALENCRNTLLTIDKAYELEVEAKKEQIERKYPECGKCSFLEKREGNKIYCFYRCKDECLLKDK